MKCKLLACSSECTVVPRCSKESEQKLNVFPSLKSLVISSLRHDEHSDHSELQTPPVHAIRKSNETTCMRRQVWNFITAKATTYNHKTVLTDENTRIHGTTTTSGRHNGHRVKGSYRRIRRVRYLSAIKPSSFIAACMLRRAAVQWCHWCGSGLSRICPVQTADSC